MTEHHTSEVVDLNGRFDLYGPVHKGLRKAQCDLLARLGYTDFGDAKASAAIVADMRTLLSLAAAHVQHEDSNIHNALRERGAVSIERLDDQHDDHRDAFRAFDTLLGQIDKAERAERIRLGRRLYLMFAGYVAHDIEHMHEEENVAAPQLWSLFTDAELMAIEGRIVGSLSPEKSMAFMRIMIPAVNPDERVLMLSAMKMGAPREAYDAVIELAARPNLPGSEFADLVRRLEMVAA